MQCIWHTEVKTSLDLHTDFNIYIYITFITSTCFITVDICLPLILLLPSNIVNYFQVSIFKSDTIYDLHCKDIEELGPTLMFFNLLKQPVVGIKVLDYWYVWLNYRTQINADTPSVWNESCLSFTEILKLSYKSLQWTDNMKIQLCVNI